MKTYLYTVATALLLVFAGCTKKNPPPLPVQPLAKANVITGQVTDVTALTAVCSGEVDYEGTSAITEVGFCWDVNSKPTTLRSHLVVGAGTGPFTTTLTSLQPNTTYYLRAYVTSLNGTSYGEEVSFKTKSAWAKINAQMSNFSTNNVVSSGGALFASRNSQPYVQKSTDGGATWTAAGTGINGNNMYNVLLFAFGNDLYLTGYSSPINFIYKSTDNGASWTPVPWPYSSIDFLLKQGSNLFAVSSYDGVYKTSNDGGNWASASAGLPSPTNYYAGDGSDNGLFIAAQGSCYRSTDNGTSWVQKNSGMPMTNIYSFCRSGNTFFAATPSNGLYASTDNGDTWTTTGAGLGGSVYQVIEASNYLFAQAAGGIFISQDNGSSWTKLNVGLPDTNGGPMIYSNSAVYLLRSDGFWKYSL